MTIKPRKHILPRRGSFDKMVVPDKGQSRTLMQWIKTLDIWVFDCTHTVSYGFDLCS